MMLLSDTVYVCGLLPGSEEEGFDSGPYEPRQCGHGSLLSCSLRLHPEMIGRSIQRVVVYCALQRQVFFRYAN